MSQVPPPAGPQAPPVFPARNEHVNPGTTAPTAPPKPRLIPRRIWQWLIKPPVDHYKLWGPKARGVKASIQMAIGLLLVMWVFIGIPVIMIFQHGVDFLGLKENPGTLHVLQELILGSVAVGLAAATAVELAHTLFTEQPDEALTPVMLALATALILQMARLDKFDWQSAVALALNVSALVGLFGIRKWLADFENHGRRH